MLKNDEEFDLIIPFYSLKAEPLNDIEAEEFINEYKNYLDYLALFKTS